MNKKIPLYQVDAFTDKLFHGNPAAVCITDQWLDDSIMQNIAAENNLAETAFVIPNGNDYGLRWFTPETEVDLCGHATLAAGFVLFKFYFVAGESIHFHSKNSGILNVMRNGNFLTLDFPADDIYPVDPTPVLLKAFNVKPLETWKGKTDYMLVFASQEEIEMMKPDMNLLDKVPARGIIVTAPGKETDFVSRFFGPQCGVPEDPVTGSAHTSLTPYWAKKLNKTELTARQLSKRKGNLKCKVNGERIEITGQARLYLAGEILLDL
jgi:PhzF family phenazine biosynthesis protein